jgi:hypothetical protein
MAWGCLLCLDTDKSEEGRWEAAVVGELTWEGGGGGEVVQAAVGAPLVYLQQAVVREAAWFAGDKRWPGRWSVTRASPASSHEDPRDRERMSGRFLVSV